MIEGPLCKSSTELLLNQTLLQNLFYGYLLATVRGKSYLYGENMLALVAHEILLKLQKFHSASAYHSTWKKYWQM